MPDLEHDIRVSTPPDTHVPPLDVDGLRRRARRRQRTRTLGAASLAIVVVVGAGVGARAWPGSFDVRIDDPAGPSPASPTVVSSDRSTASDRLQRLVDATREELADAKRQREELVQQISVLQQELDSPSVQADDERRDQVHGELERRQAALDETDERIAMLRNRLEELEAHEPATDVLTVPDVVGLAESVAREELEGAGLVVQAFQLITDDPADEGVVLGQSPPAGVHDITDDPDTPVDETDMVVIQVGVTSPTAAEDNDPQATGWFTDDQREDDPRTSGWVAAWFAPEGAGPPDASVRWWRHVADEPLTPAEEAHHAVDALDVDPPPGMLSAFGRGLTVHGVTYDAGQVTVDLDADSPGLHGHSTHGLILGSSQLGRIASHHFPEAETLCVAYDGTPTSIEAGGPYFLHDADGCPIPLE